MESCDFVNEEFPAVIQKFTKKQQVLNYAKYSNFLYKVYKAYSVSLSARHMLSYCKQFYHLSFDLVIFGFIISSKNLSNFEITSLTFLEFFIFPFFKVSVVSL
jgi:hypothetical protein